VSARQRTLAICLTWLAPAGTGDAEDDDDKYQERYGDCRRGYGARPVESRGRGRRRDRDFQAHAGQDLLGELPVVMARGWAAKGVRDRDDSEGDGAGCGCADDDPGGELAVGSRQLGAVSAGRRTGQVGEQDRQLFPGAGAQRLLGPLFQLAGSDPADLEGFAQVTECLVAICVRDPQVASGKFLVAVFMVRAPSWPQSGRRPLLPDALRVPARRQRPHRPASHGCPGSV
jgi:hypothetical protein